jgi:hypothetical protein
MTATTSTAVELGSLRLSAKIDYLTVFMGAHVPLPKLSGTPRWLKGVGRYGELTIHDATPNDVADMTSEFGAIPLTELEVCVDFRCRSNVHPQDRKQALSSVMVDLIAKGLYPRNAPMMKQAARTFYRRMEQGYSIGPFNRRLPSPTDQQLHGWRGDYAQVKAYYKRFDMRRALEERLHSARVEVRLARSGLHEHGLLQLNNLFDFDFRREFGPFFRFTRGAQHRRSGKESSMLTVMRDELQRRSDAEWQNCGVGAFQPGGRLEHASCRLLRDLEANDRIGQALYRLQKSFRNEKFVRFESYPDARAPALVRPTGRSSQSAMTIQ